MGKVKDLCKELAQSAEYKALQEAKEDSVTAHKVSKVLLGKIDDLLIDVGSNVTGLDLRSEINSITMFFYSHNYSKVKQLKIFLEGVERQIRSYLPCLYPHYKRVY